MARLKIAQINSDAELAFVRPIRKALEEIIWDSAMVNLDGSEFEYEYNEMHNYKDKAYFPQFRFKINNDHECLISYHANDDKPFVIELVAANGSVRSGGDLETLDGLLHGMAKYLVVSLKHGDNFYPKRIQEQLKLQERMEL
jgi:hypothetical protein